MSESKWMAVRITDEIIYIHDIGGGYNLSVTNDAENVVYTIVNNTLLPYEHGYGDKRIVYRDSMGQWGELLHDGDQFTGYAPYAEDGLT